MPTPSPTDMYRPDPHYSASEEKSCCGLRKIHSHVPALQGLFRFVLLSGLLRCELEHRSPANFSISNKRE